MKTINTLIYAAIITLFISSCSKDGATGPQGPAGNANVTATTIQVNSSDWITNSNYSWEIDYSFSNPLNSSGAMECYYSPDATDWIQLPWVSSGNSPYFEQAWVYNSSNIAISWYNITSGSLTTVTPPNIAYFKIVSIPPAFMMKHPNINWNDKEKVSQLQEVKAALNSCSILKSNHIQSGGTINSKN